MKPKQAKSTPAASPAAARSLWSRIFLSPIAGIIVALLAMWGFAKVVYDLTSGPVASSTAPTVTPDGVQARTIYIRVDDDFMRMVSLPSTRWFFAGMTWPQAQAQLQALRVSNPASYAPYVTEGAEGTAIAPPLEKLLALSRDERTRLYLWLGVHPGNPDMAYPFCYSIARLDKRFKDLSPATRKRVEALFYTGPAGRVYLADAGSACEGLDDGERVKLVQAISEQETLLLSVRVDAGTNVEALAAKWANHNVSRDYMPLLRSVQASGQTVDLDMLHLLPRFAKGFAYTYPSFAMPRDDVPKDCFWTAINFHGYVTDYSLDNARIIEILRTKYQTMPPGTEPRFGDLIAYFTPAGDSIHVAVHISGDIVFTKNGSSMLSPWIFQRRSAMEEFYPQLEGARIEILRNIQAY